MVPGSKVVARVFPDEDIREERYQLDRDGIVQPVGAEEEVIFRAGGITSERLT